MLLAEEGQYPTLSGMEGGILSILVQIICKLFGGKEQNKSISVILNFDYVMKSLFGNTDAWVLLTQILIKWVWV